MIRPKLVIGGFVFLVVAVGSILLHDVRSQETLARPNVATTINLPVENSNETTLIHGAFETQGNLQQPGSFSGQENGETHLQDAGQFSPEDLDQLEFSP